MKILLQFIRFLFGAMCWGATQGVQGWTHLTSPKAFDFWIADSHGKAEFMSKKEQLEEFNPIENRGFVIAPGLRMSSEMTDNHFLFGGPSGSGKTSCYGTTQLLERAGEASFVVADLKGTMRRDASGLLKEKGYRIDVVQLDDWEHSNRYCPLVRCRSDQDRKILALGLVNRVSETDAPYWGISARTPLFLLFAALQAGAQERVIDGNKVPGAIDPRQVNMGNVRKLLNQMSTYGGAGMDFLMEHLPVHLRDEAQAFFSQDSKQVSQHLATARTAIEDFSMPELCELTAEDNLSIEHLRDEKRPVAIFIQCKPHRMKYFGIVANLLYGDVFRFCMENPDGMPVQVILDEFANVGKLNDFTNTLTTIREYRVSIAMFIQDLGQLEAVYGPRDSKTIMSAQTKIFLPGTPLETSETIERYLGKKTVFTNPHGGLDVKAQTVAKSLLASDEVRMIKRGEAIMITHNRKPALLESKPYDHQKRLKPLIKPGIAAPNSKTPKFMPLYIEVQEQIEQRTGVAARVNAAIGGAKVEIPARAA